MTKARSELEKAQEELSFWQDFLVWWRTAGDIHDDPRIIEAIDKAQLRYSQAQGHKLESTQH